MSRVLKATHLRRCLRKRHASSATHEKLICLARATHMTREKVVQPVILATVTRFPPACGFSCKQNGMNTVGSSISNHISAGGSLHWKFCSPKNEDICILARLCTDQQILSLTPCTCSQSLPVSAQPGRGCTRATRNATSCPTATVTATAYSVRSSTLFLASIISSC